MAKFFSCIFDFLQEEAQTTVTGKILLAIQQIAPHSDRGKSRSIFFLFMKKHSIQTAAT